MTNVDLLVALFLHLQGITYWEILDALRRYIGWRLVSEHNADERQRLQNFLARLPEVPK